MTVYIAPGIVRQMPDRQIIDVECEVIEQVTKLENDPDLIPVDHIIDEVCAAYGTTKAELMKMNGRRCAPWKEIRQVIMWLIRLHWGQRKSFSQIGALFGLDHCTAIYARSVVNDIRSTDKYFRKLTDGLLDKIPVNYDK